MEMEEEAIRFSSYIYVSLNAFLLGTRGSWFANITILVSFEPIGIYLHLRLNMTVRTRNATKLSQAIGWLIARQTWALSFTKDHEKLSLNYRLWAGHKKELLSARGFLCLCSTSLGADGRTYRKMYIWFSSKFLETRNNKGHESILCTDVVVHCSAICTADNLLFCIQKYK